MYHHFFKILKILQYTDFNAFILYARESTTPLRNIGVDVCLGSLIVLGQMSLSAENRLSAPADLFARQWNLPRLFFWHSRYKFIWQRVIPVNLLLRSRLNIYFQLQIFEKIITAYPYLG